MLAVWTDWLEARAASGTEAEAGFHDGITLRTVSDARLAQNEIQDDAETVGDEDSDEGPEKTAHSPSFGVFVDVTDEDDVASEHRSHHQRKQAANGKNGGMTVASKDEYEKYGRAHEDCGRKDKDPARDDADLVLESRGSLVSNCHGRSPAARTVFGKFISAFASRSLCYP